jgi:hypothetical protein
VESEGRPLGLGRRMRNAATATTMMPMMTKTMSGLGWLVLLPGGLDGASMVGWMRDPDLRFFGGGPSGSGRHPPFLRKETRGRCLLRERQKCHWVNEWYLRGLFDVARFQDEKDAHGGQRTYDENHQ